ncbi:MAG: TonB-dependent receptor [Bacteroidales bacterium]|nr:TonB-dependent receptor [Bacteroidales bacterium]
MYKYTLKPKKSILYIALTVFISYNIFGLETYYQTIKGKVVEQNTEFPLIGATVVLVGSNPVIGTVTDTDGHFRLENVPVGRQSLQINYLGYKPRLINNIVVISGKEVILNITMEENIIQGDEIIIKANGRKDRPVNEMALISARSFTVEETERYAGNWLDPARMASSFAGVMSAADQTNDIIIRGNSPTGLLWNLEGINIPNPNHFGGIGTTGGPISMLNTNVLSNSDFYSGAFPSGYGNAISGVFDLKMRSGNNEKREYIAQVGMNGFELGAEGPIFKTLNSGKNPTFLINYRYSTLSVFDKLGINMGIGATPYYQDLSFKLDLPGTKYGRFTLFGLGGENHIEFNSTDTIIPVKQIAQNLYGVEDTTIVRTDYTYFSSLLGVIGLSHTYFFNENTRIKSTLAASYTGGGAENRGKKYDEINYIYGDNMNETKYSLNIKLMNKLNAKNNFETGLNIDYYLFTYIDSFYNKKYDSFFNNYKTSGNEMFLYQGNVLWKNKPNEKTTFVIGLNFMQNSLNKNYSIEPRISAEWNITKNRSVSIGYGMHSQLQPRLVYFIETLTDSANFEYKKTNTNLGFTKSHHFVSGYNLKFSDNLRLKVEAYYQHHFNIPVKELPSYFSLINYGTSAYQDYDFDSLVNKGTGRNYGLEITIERFLANNFYYTFTASLFDSKYTGSDGTERNTVFNGNYVFNALGGYEFKFKNQHSLAINLKGVWAGGLRQIPVLLEESFQKGYAVYDYSKAFYERNESYYRIDIAFSYIINRSKSTHTLTLDIRNVTNHINPFIQDFDIETGKIEKLSQLGFVPAGIYRINF